MRYFFGSRILLFLSLSLIGLCAAEKMDAQEVDPEGLQLLIDTAMNRGALLIRTGEFEFLQTSIESPPTESQIKEQVKATAKNLQEIIDRTDDESLKAVYQKSIDNLEAEMRPQIIANASRKSKYRYVFSEKARYIEFANFEKQQEAWQPPVELLETTNDHAAILGKRTRPSIVFDHGPGMFPILSSTGSYVGIHPPHAIGRVTGFLAKVANNLDDEFAKWLKGSAELTTVVKLTNKEVETFEVKYKMKSEADGVESFSFHIVPSRGYITPLVQELDENGILVRQWKCEEYFQPKGQELWYPKKCTFRATGTRFQKAVRQVYLFDESKVTINDDIPKERLTILIPADQTVLDARNQKDQKHFRALKDVLFSLGDVDSLQKNDAFEEKVYAE